MRNEMLLQALTKRLGEPCVILHQLELDHVTTLGVFGDPDNACYEWFIWGGEGNLQTSDRQYGMTLAALRDVLNEAWPA